MNIARQVDGEIESNVIRIPERMNTDALIRAAPHLSYAVDVLTDRILGGKLTKLACLRALEDHERLSGGNVWEWRSKPPENVVKFCSYVPHIEGVKADKKETLKLERWQIFLVSEIYGWRSASNPNERRFKDAVLEISRKNGKTFWSATLALYEVLFGEQGGKLFSLATRKEQSNIVWEMCAEIVVEMTKRGGDGAALLEAMTVTANLIKTARAEFKSLPKSHSLDGFNPSVIIFDEAASILDSDSINKMTTGAVSRLSPLTLWLTTPQRSTTTVYYGKREFLRMVLEKLVDPYSEEADSIFGMIYQLDSEAEINDESNWIKSNPNLNESVQLSGLRRTWATRTNLTEPTIKMLHFGLWQAGTHSWMAAETWKACASEPRRSGACFGGIDLALTGDLAAVVLVFTEWDGRYWVEFKCFTNSEAFDNLPERLKLLYQSARDSGVLIISEGATIDEDAVEQYIRECQEEYSVLQWSFDPWNAKKLVSRLSKDGFTMLKVNQGMNQLNDVIQEIDTLIRKKKINHDNDPFILWQMENCVVYQDKNDNYKVRKPDDDRTRKIDGIAGMITAYAGVDQDVVPTSDFEAVFIQL